MAHPKGLLIERAQKLGLDRPEFETAQTGPEHEPSFLCDVTIGGELLGTGQGSSKREAERRAAEEALAALDRRESGSAARATTAKAGRGGGSSRAAESAPAQAAPAAPAAKAPAPGSAPEAAPGPLAQAAGASADDVEDAPFTGPWPMVDDVLASVIQTAERRVSADLRGEAALVAIKDFALRLYKEILADLGEVVDEEDEDEE